VTTDKFALKGKRVWVAGHAGMVGAALTRRLASEDCEILTASRSELDLTGLKETSSWMAAHKPDAVFLAAARVGGILANSQKPVDFLRDNLLIETNVMEAAHASGVKKLLFLGSSCIYPRLAPQPMSEDALLTGPLEETNQWYAIAKIAGIKLAQAWRRQFGADYISAMPTNLYGPNDNFNLDTSHVIPALLRKAHEAKVKGLHEVTVWGSGKPLREFMHVDDCADACIYLMNHYSGEGHVNVGTGEEVSIRGIAELVCDVVGVKAKLTFDQSKPDGTPRKLLDVSLLRSLGWRHRIDLDEGLKSTYAWYVKHATSR